MNETQPGTLTPSNTLLAMLPEHSRAALPHLETVTLQAGTVLFEPDQQIDHIYFPIDALVSILSLGEDGATIEIGLIGRDGLVGLPALLGGVMPYRAVVQTMGDAFRMKCGRIIEEEYSKNRAFQTLLLKYANAFTIQVAQSSLCNCYHPLQERVCRWLMVAHDGACTNSLRVTHDTMARLLGTRRASITSTLGLLQKARLIELTRGRITILDPRALQSMCCECYLIIRDGMRQITID